MVTTTHTLLHLYLSLKQNSSPWFDGNKIISFISNHRTICLISHSGKIVARILSKRLESKIEEVIEEDQFGFRKGKGTRDAIGLMRIISERDRKSVV